MRTERPVFGLDIDGTIAHYHDHFAWFCSMYFGLAIPLGYDGSMPFYKWVGVSKTRYREAKLAYRRSGLKRAMRPHDGARALTTALRAKGALVVICTTRPFLALEVVEEDTRIWLRRNGVQYDGLINGEHKYRTLAKDYGKQRVFGVMDDLPEMVQQAEKVGLPSILRRAPHNQDFAWTTEAASLVEAQAIALEWLDKWKVNR